MKNVLITGGAGFIGANLIKYLLKKNDENIKIFNVDSLTYASDLDSLHTQIGSPKNYLFIKADINDYNEITRIFAQHNITDVIHLAAESHVDNSIKDPFIFTRTNVLGTHTLLEAARAHSQNNKFNRFHHVSTDEVYGTLKDEGYFTEDSQYQPSSPYSASKAASDHIVKSYFKTYGLDITISNCSNNFGPLQHDEKLIPTIIRKALSNEKIPIYGQGQNIRDWLYVEDHCKAIESVWLHGKSGETYNVGSNNEWKNIDLAHLICESLNKLFPERNFNEQIKFVTDRLGHDYRYAIDAKKIKSELNWKESSDFNESLDETVRWYIKKYEK